MRYSFAILALAGASLAAPTRVIRDNVRVVDDVVVDTKIDYVTDYVTVYGPSPTATAAAAPAPHNQDEQQAAPSPAAPQVSVVTVAAPAATAATPAPKAQAPSPAPAPAPASAPAPAPAPAQGSSSSSSSTSSSSGSNPNDGSPMSGNMSMLEIANKYRSLYNLPTFTWSAQLQANAQKTDNDDKGSQETHELNSGSLAQVITPGNDNESLMGLQPFEVGYVGGWLCEEPVQQLGGICPQLDKQAGLDVAGDTEHAAILRNPQYKAIGCAWTSNNNHNEWGGLWVCDLN